MESLENTANVLEGIADAWLESPKDAHIQVQSNRTGEVIELDMTTALTLEGYFNGCATELGQAGWEDVVDGIAERHGLNIERVKDGER